MNSRYLFFSTGALILLLLLGLYPPMSFANQTGQDLLIFYSNDVKGETEACG